MFRIVFFRTFEADFCCRGYLQSVVIILSSAGRATLFYNRAASLTGEDYVEPKPLRDECSH